MKTLTLCSTEVSPISAANIEVNIVDSFTNIAQKTLKMNAVNGNIRQIDPS